MHIHANLEDANGRLMNEGTNDNNQINDDEDEIGTNVDGNPFEVGYDLGGHKNLFSNFRVLKLK
jgi:hypothetical protein